MPIDNPRYFWDVVDVPYQMGPHKHRLYLLSLLQKKGVKSLLDVGCGTGPIFDLIISDENWDSFTRYKGVDYSPNFIGWAMSEWKGANFEVQDARNLNEPDNSYDCVLLLHSLDHVKEFDKVIAEAARVSKKYVCIVVWRALRDDAGVEINETNREFKKPEEEPWEDTYLLQFSKEVLKAEFDKNNLVIEEEVEGEILNSGQSKYNYLFLLRKDEKK